MGDLCLYVFYHEFILLTTCTGIKACGLEEQVHLSTWAAGGETEEAREQGAGPQAE